MAVETHRIELDTQGHTHVLDVTPQVSSCLEAGVIQNGTVTVFVIGSTAALTTTEFEPGLAKTDLRAAFERFAPEDGRYAHEETWHDDNGHAHVRASIVGPSICVPLIDKQMPLGTWQQIILIDFDTRPRSRTLIVQVLGE